MSPAARRGAGASIRPGHRKDGSPYWSVLYRLDGQRSKSFNKEADAQRFQTLVKTLGAADALRAVGLEPPAPREALTVAAWLDRYIAMRTAIEQKSIDDYQRYARLNIGPTLGSIPLAELTEEDIAAWMHHLEATVSRRGTPYAAKTVRNIHGFLSGALDAAVPRLIPANPAAGRRLPQGSGDDLRVEDRMLSRDEFDRLLAATTDYWKPLVMFLVASGCRWGEAVCLKPGDVNRDAGTVRVQRAWKYSSAGYEIGRPKTTRSNRTINIGTAILDQLDYTGEYLFTNRAGGPVRYPGFRRRVWNPAVERAQLDPKPTPHALRHTCASWMLNAGVPITTVSRHLGHESIQITVDTYGHLDRTVAAQAAAVMGELLARPAQKAIEAAPAETSGPETP